MTRDKMNYLIYTDFYRVYGKEMSIKDNVKLFLNYHMSAGLYILFLIRKCQYYIKKNRIIFHLYKMRYNKAVLRYGIEIPLSVEIAEGCIIYHTNGIVLHPNTKIGKNCSLLQQVTVGNNGKKSRDIVAVIGNNVSIGAGAKIIGPIVIGNDVRIGANAVVTHNVADKSVVAGIPAKTISLNDCQLNNVNYLCFEDWLLSYNKKRLKHT